MARVANQHTGPVYDPDKLMPEILTRLEAGELLRQIVRTPGMPSVSQIVKWGSSDAWNVAYARAREAGWHAIAEEAFEISDDGRNDWIERENRSGGVETVADTDHIARSRLRVDTRKWLLSKMLPKIYGEKQSVDHNVNGNLTVAIDLSSVLGNEERKVEDAGGGE